MQMQIDNNIQKAMITARTEPWEIEDLEGYSSMSLILFMNGDTPVFTSNAWINEKLPLHFQKQSGRFYTLRSEKGARYRMKTVKVSENKYLTIGQDEEMIRNTLKTFALILLLVFPPGLLISGLGGYFLAGRLLAPVHRMTEKAKRIDANNLSERLPIENPNDEFGVLASIFNSTLSRLEDSFERLRSFTADASHELRTPLTAIRSVGEVALQRQLDGAEYRDCIGSMLEETNRVTRLVDKLLTLTRTERGTANLHIRPLKIADFLERLVDNYRILAEDKELRIEEVFDPDIVIETDEVSLRLAVSNLLDNAIKYTQAGGKIIVSLYSSEKEVCIEVADNGPGIPIEHREKIFDRFYRIERSRSAETGGTGLGLAIALQAVNANRGRIEVVSREDAGIVFRIVLPV
jgi:heavy metal sensor kinase